MYSVEGLDRKGSFFLWQQAERYLNVGRQVRRVMKIDSKEKTIEYATRTSSWNCPTLLKVLSFALFLLPLTALAICTLYRSQYRFSRVKKRFSPKVVAPVTAPPTPKKEKEGLPAGVKAIIGNYCTNSQEVCVLRIPSEEFDRGITHLNFSDQPQLTDEQLAGYVKRYPNAEYVSLAGCKKITNEGLACVQDWKHLFELVLTGCEVADQGVKQLQGCSKLSVLSLLWCGNVTGMGLRYLQECKKLSVLDLRGCAKIVGNALVFLVKCKTLRMLALGGASVMDATLAPLGGCPNLSRLCLFWSPNVTNAGIVHLQGCNALVELHFTECEGITRGGVRYLWNCKKLDILYVNHCKNITKKPHERFRRFSV